jgi:hypothetical protein
MDSFQFEWALLANVATAKVDFSLVVSGISHAPTHAASSSHSFGSLIWHSSIPAPAADR